MVKFTVSSKAVTTQSADCYLFLVENNTSKETFSLDTEIVTAAKKYFPDLKAYMKEQEFFAKRDQALLVQGFNGTTRKQLLFMGLGQRKEEIFPLEEYRRIIATAMRIAEKNKIASIAFHLPTKKMFGYDAQFMAQTTATIGLMAQYQFDDFIKDAAKVYKTKEVVIVAPEKEKKVIQEGIKTGQIIADAVNRSRHWVDLPANVLSPAEIAKRAKVLAKKHNLECTVFDEKKIEKLGMGGLKAVGMGSQHDAQMVIMQYTCKKKNAPTLALVGKGITFDSGGLNIKPTGYMETMKEDMTGSAAVINAIVAISQLKPDVNVVAVAALAENMVSGSSNHPGDIITFYNGVTAVVGNTDAEGRLVLADALAYASKHFKPTAMIDVATLTGAASHAVGPFFNCVLTPNDLLAEKVAQAGYSSGDATWRLPFIERYKKMVSSEIADICNDGKTKYYAGPTNGACFLSNFVGDTPWVHVDIAPTAFDVPDTPYYRPGSATGSGTRLLIDFVMQFKNKMLADCVCLPSYR